MKRRVYKNGLLDEHPILFPNTLRHQGAGIRVPIDDSHTTGWRETQGRIADRIHERLGTSDWGIALLRQVMDREIRRVQRGLDPLGVIRDPDHAVIDTKLDQSLEEYWGQPRQATLV